MPAEIKIQIRCTLEEKKYFQNAAKVLGFKSLSEYFRVAAFEKISRSRGQNEQNRD